MKRLLFCVLFVFMIFPFINADVISLNSGGSDNVIVNPHEQIEGFFSCVPFTCGQLGYECSTWSDGCGRTLNCGTCASGFTCDGGTCVESGGGGGGAGGGGGGAAGYSLTIEPTNFDINLAVNTTIEETISVTSHESNQITLGISETNLDQHLILGTDSLVLDPGETEQFKVTFVAGSQPGIYTGLIILGGHVITISLNVQTKLLLFDSNIVVLNDNYQVPQGDRLRTQVTLIPLGDDARLDVTLNYVIKDYQGNIYLTRSETLLVDSRIDLKRNFGTGSLPLGQYVVGLELIYPNGVAPSSAHFEVVEGRGLGFGRLILFLVILIIIVMIILVIFLLRRERDKRRRQQGIVQ